MKYKSTVSIKVTSILILGGMMGCGYADKKPLDTVDLDTGSADMSEVAERMPSSTALKPAGDPEKDVHLVDMAVDAWLYFHLSDYKSYEPLIRTCDYEDARGVYIQHLLYRMMNEQGGMVTKEQDFEVDLNRSGENGNPFYVEPISIQ